MSRSRRLWAACAALGATALALGVSATPVLAKHGAATAGYTLDGYGVLHPMTIGGVASPAETAASAGNHTWNWQIARGMAEQTNHTDGLVLDGFGGLHGWGTNTTNNAAPANPTNAPYWQGWDIARGVVLTSGSASSGYVLDGFGGLHPFGSAPAVTATGYMLGKDIFHSIDIDQTTTGGAGPFSCDVVGYTLDGYGGVHPFTDNKSAGDDPSCQAPSSLTVTITGSWPSWNIARSVALDADSNAGADGFTLDGFGGLHPWCAYVTGSTACTLPATPTGAPYWSGWDIARAISSIGTGTGWVLDAFGGVHSYGGAAAPVSSGYSSGIYKFRDMDEN